ncbi:MAG: hypothetical protein KDI71_10360, partial [Xanthomonadales bacterium]|nr:hypothetical protein [Xanthomonadales bacterium]
MLKLGVRLPQVFGQRHQLGLEQASLIDRSCRPKPQAFAASRRVSHLPPAALSRSHTAAIG